MSDIPLRGIVGVIDAKAAGRILDGEALPKHLGGVELRADDLEDFEQATDVLKRIPRRFPVLFTIRTTEQGGKWSGDDEARVELFERALHTGAAMVDVEWGSRAAEAIAATQAPLVLSHHNFERAPSDAELIEWTEAMSALEPRVIKIVSTATELQHSVQMLEWVKNAGEGSPARVGFAMGPKGLPSRVLSISRGAPYTYGALGDAVAPGQPSTSELAELYRADVLTPKAELFAVVGNPISHSLSPHMHNAQLAAHRVDAVYLPVLLDEFDELEPCWESLRLRGVSVTIPFKEDACRRADRLDDKARRASAANTLVALADDTVPGSRMRVAAYNTDYEGVLEPLRLRLDRLEGVQVAVLGNGGAARGAVEALKEARACPTIIYRNVEKGPPVAQELSIPARHFDEFRAEEYRVVINATSLGLKRDDPSPIPREAFSSDLLAFDMVYDPPNTAFSVNARERGAECINGGEMLISQGLVQYRLYTGREPDREVFAAGFNAGQAARATPNSDG